MAESKSEKPKKAVFFDVRDTLGIVDRPGHLVPFRPSTDQLLALVKSVVGLRIGIISNLPDGVSVEAGRKMLDDAGVSAHLDPQGVVFNHDAAAAKPKPEIYAFAAKRMKLAVDECLFVGENLPEVIGAYAAGMDAVLKPLPPGGEFLLRPIPARPPTERDSGRISEMVMEEDHLVAKRIVICAGTIAKRLEPVIASLAPNGAERRTPADLQVPLEAMGLLVFLVKSFVDPYHHRKEEEVLIPIALARGMPPAMSAFVAPEHEQGRAYFSGLDVALRRYQAADVYALRDFARNAMGVVELYREHGRKEDDDLFKTIGRYLTDGDDAVILELFSQVGPRNLNVYLAIIQDLEQLLGITPS